MRASYSPNEAAEIVGKYVAVRVAKGESVEVASEVAAEHYGLDSAAKAKACYERLED